jgi:hypothetical protein
VTQPLILERCFSGSKPIPYGRGTTRISCGRFSFAAPGEEIDFGDALAACARLIAVAMGVTGAGQSFRSRNSSPHGGVASSGIPPLCVAPRVLRCRACARR